MYYCPAIAGFAPNWVYAVCGVCVFLFQTFDAVDGKQARRTKYLFPLGDLFDHGSDMLTFSVGIVTMSSMLQLNPVATLALVLWGSVLPGYAYHWEMRYTRSLALVRAPVHFLLPAVVCSQAVRCDRAL
jgi:phosphatidylglycerophosphate synthase